MLCESVWVMWMYDVSVLGCCYEISLMKNDLWSDATIITGVCLLLDNVAESEVEVEVEIEVEDPKEVDCQKTTSIYTYPYLCQEAGGWVACLFPFHSYCHVKC